MSRLLFQRARDERPPALSAITEAQWQRTVLDGLRLFGWRAFHDRMAYRSDPGYPDLTAIHTGQRRVIWLELKTERGKLSVAQQEWRDTLLGAGLEWYLWRPSDWSEVEAVLRGKRYSPSGVEAP